LTFSSEKLRPPKATEDPRDEYRWRYRVFELLNGIQTILGSGIEVTAAGVITETTLQGVIGQLNTLIAALQAADTTLTAADTVLTASDVSLAAADAAHVAAADPHPLYATDAEVTAAVSAHVAASDPHTQYQKESEKDAAIGYAGLNADSRTTKGVITTDDLIVNLNGKGLVLKDNASPAHYWRVSVSTIGALATQDLGTSAP